ncbi:MAG: sulfate respiration complex hexadecaheme cytochrome HmcA [Pseudomonadota bacterium]
MKMEKKGLRLIVALTLFLGCTYGTGIAESAPADGSSSKRADVIKIDSMAVFGKLEKPVVVFLHDNHTKALAEKNKDCSTCHLTGNNRMVPKFKRLTDTDKTDVMNIYHQGCIACHGEMNLAKEKTGPVECGDCHTQKETYASSRQPMGFDKTLHFNHSKKSENKCEQCHHEYNETKKELIYVKGKEGTCRYCHEQKTQDNRISMRQASHLACINCHINTAVKEKTNPPLTCARCHDPIEQDKSKQQRLAKQTDLPRIERNQPDIVLLKTVPKDLKPNNYKIDQTISRMDFVPFDHKSHENSNDTCRVCHHESLQPCGECHTLTGSPAVPAKGLADSKTATNPTSLAKAMHKIDSQKSCQGCHNTRMKQEKCAGCHAPMDKAREKKPETCIKCHSVPVKNITGSTRMDDELLLARTALQSGKQKIETYNQNDIPEIVTIRILSKEYEPVDFPHRKVVNALSDRIKANSLTQFFHHEKNTICQGCHHNSPESIKPPQCRNCHNKQWEDNTPPKPGILGAYHQQCMGCHEQMNIQKPVGCTECHKKKTLK